MARLVEVTEDEPKGYRLVPVEEASVSLGRELNGIPRQLGLAARYALEGPADALQTFTEPVAGLMRLAGIKAAPLGQIAAQAADSIGLPVPAGANERTVAAATRLGFGAMGGIGAAGNLAKLGGIPGQVGAALSAAPASQVMAASGAGGAGQASKEAGGNLPLQIGASVVGGVAGGLVPSVASAGANAVKSFGRNVINELKPADLDAQVSAVIKNTGLDLASMSASARAALRSDVEAALRTGEIDANAVRRLADIRAAGMTPTRGMLTLDPVQVTRERNLAKTGANSADPALNRLAQIENENNAALIQRLNERGATSGNLMTAGGASIGDISTKDAAWKARVSALYEQARNMPGGETPLDRKTLIDNIYGALAKENKLAYLPADIAETLNTISAGAISRNGQKFAVPFDAKALDNLMTDIASAQRSTKDGNIKAALAIARSAIDKTPITPIKAPLDGVVTEAGGKFLQQQDAQAGKFMDALNKARAEASARFRWQESSRPVDAALSGAAPDDFVRKFIISKDGKYRDAQAVAAELTEPSREAVRNSIIAHLKERALNGAKDETGKFSQSAYNKALQNIGGSKLGLFFSKEEIDALQAYGRAASYAQFQPAGSAVNNSNSGALLIGKGIDALAKFGSYMPGVGPLVVDPIKIGITNTRQGMQQKAATQIAPSLLSVTPEQQAPMRYVLPATLAAGGLLQ